MNWTTSEAMLIYNYKPKWYSGFMQSTCCYSEILRTGSGKHADGQFKYVSLENHTHFKITTTISLIFTRDLLIDLDFHRAHISIKLSNFRLTWSSFL